MSRSLALLVLTLFMLATCAWGDPSANNRSPQVPVATAGPNSLQSLLDQIYGCSDCVDAASDQTTSGMWKTSTAIHQVVTSVLDFTFPTGSPDTFGIWSTVSNLVPIFLGTATADNNSGATLRWNSSGVLTVGAVDPTDCGISINCESGITGVDPTGFGFYLTTPGGQTYYTMDYANPNGSAQALTYNSQNEWAIAFNDTQVTAGTPGSYNNMVVGVQSITALPEPRSIILLGTTVLVASGFGRRRLRRKKT